MSDFVIVNAQAGDTFETIAKRYSMSSLDLAAINRNRKGWDVGHPRWRTAGYLSVMTVFESGMTVKVRRNKNLSIIYEQQRNVNGNAVTRVKTKEEKSALSPQMEFLKTANDVLDRTAVGVEGSVGKSRVYWGLVHDKTAARKAFQAGADPRAIAPRFDPSKVFDMKVYPETANGKVFYGNQSKATASAKGAAQNAGKVFGVVGDIFDVYEVGMLVKEGKTEEAGKKTAGVAASKFGEAKGLAAAGRACPKKNAYVLGMCLAGGFFGGGKFAEEISNAYYPDSDLIKYTPEDLKNLSKEERINYELAKQKYEEQLKNNM